MRRPSNVGKWRPRGKRPKSGGNSITATSLSRGDYIRDPHKVDRILVVIRNDGTEIYARGLNKDETNIHRFFNLNDGLVKVTNCETPDSILLSSEEV